VSIAACIYVVCVTVCVSVCVCVNVCARDCLCTCVSTSVYVKGGTEPAWPGAVGYYDVVLFDWPLDSHQP